MPYDDVGRPRRQAVRLSRLRLRSASPRTSVAEVHWLLSVAINGRISVMNLKIRQRSQGLGLRCLAISLSRIRRLRTTPDAR